MPNTRLGFEAAALSADGPFKVTLIGAGNIGSRHLQGLAHSDLPLDVTVVEQNNSAADLSRQRLTDALAMSGKVDFNCRWGQKIEDLPQRIDLAIIATSAESRRQIVEQLLQHAVPRFLILEKFLFQNREDYSAVGDLLKAHGVATYVNTPRRCWPSYQNLLTKIPTNGDISIEVGISTMNGLATNAIHMIDLLGFLTRDRSDLEIDGSGLTLPNKQSRHQRTIEFDGVLLGNSKAGDFISMKTLAENSDDDLIRIKVANLVFHVNEREQKMSISDEKGVFDTVDFPVVLQSQLSGAIADELFLKSNCSLPTYSLSAGYHVACLEAFRSAQSRLTGRSMSICRVT